MMQRGYHNKQKQNKELLSWIDLRFYMSEYQWNSDNKIYGFDTPSFIVHIFTHKQAKFRKIKWKI